LHFLWRVANPALRQLRLGHLVFGNAPTICRRSNATGREDSLRNRCHKRLADCAATLDLMQSILHAFMAA